MNNPAKLSGRRLATIYIAARSFYRAALDFVYPPYCLLCESGLHEDEDLVCLTCLQSLKALKNPLLPADKLPGFPVTPPFFNSSLALFSYSTAVQELVHLFKYRGYKGLGKLFGKMIGKSLLLNHCVESLDALVPVPLHIKRLRERGFNQAGLIARCAADKCGLEVWEEALIRRRYTAPQATMKREERLVNIQGAFETVDFGKIENARVALVDDVLTTGSTMNECARVLRQAGAASVMSVTIVRV
jgi:competence protein ComFC